MYVVAISVMFVLITFCSCDWFYNKDEAKKLILQKEPSFVKILNEKERIDKDIGKIKNLLSNKKEMTNTKIKILKREYAQEAKKLNLEIQNLQSQLNVHIEKIDLDIRSLSGKLKSKKRILKNIESMIKEAGNLLTGDSQIQLAPKERKRWQKKLNDLKSQKKEVFKEVESLKDTLHREKTKIKLLR